MKPGIDMQNLLNEKEWLLDLLGETLTRQCIPIFIE